MKKILLLVLCFTMFGSSFCLASTFKDTHDPVVVWVSGEGIMNGYPDGSFKPGRTLTRAEFATLLARILEPQIKIASAASYTASPLKDLDQVSWAKTSALYLNRQGYIQGFPDGTFKGEKKVTGYEAAAVILRSIYGFNGKFFPSDYVNELQNYGVNLENGDKPATRYQTARLLYDLYTKTGKMKQKVRLHASFHSLETAAIKEKNDLILKILATEETAQLDKDGKLILVTFQDVLNDLNTRLNVSYTLTAKETDGRLQIEVKDPWQNESRTNLPMSF